MRTVECFSESSYGQIMHRLLRDYEKTIPPSMFSFYVASVARIVNAAKALFYLITYTVFVYYTKAIL